MKLLPILRRLTGLLGAASLIALTLGITQLRQVPPSEPENSDEDAVAAETQETPKAVTNSHPTPQKQQSSGQTSFEQVLVKTLEELPRRQSLQRISEEEAHGTPQVVVQAGEALGQIAQAIADKPELLPQATAFYQKCASDKEVLTSIRALCYSHLLGKSGTPREIDLPAEVVRLAKLIPQP